MHWESVWCDALGICVRWSTGNLSEVMHWVSVSICIRVFCMTVLSKEIDFLRLVLRRILFEWNHVQVKQRYFLKGDAARCNFGKRCILHPSQKYSTSMSLCAVL